MVAQLWLFASSAVALQRMPLRSARAGLSGVTTHMDRLSWVRGGPATMKQQSSFAELDEKRAARSARLREKLALIKAHNAIAEPERQVATWRT